MAELAVLILISQNLALGKSIPWDHLPGTLGHWIWIALTIVFCAGAISLSRSRAGDPDAASGRGISARARRAIQRLFASRAWLPALLALNAGIALFNFLRFREFGYALPWSQLALIGAGLLLIRRGDVARSGLLSLGILATSILHFPLHPTRSDMLPVIQAALDHWRAGISPYLPIEFPWNPVRVPYLPGTLASNLPAWWLGLDLRWNQFLYRAIVVLLLARASATLPRDHRARDVAQLYLLSPYLNFRHELYFEGFLAMVLAWQLAPRARPAIFPLLVVTRQWAWVLAPFLLVEEARRRGARRVALLVGGLAAAIALSWLALRSSTSLEVFTQAIQMFQEKIGRREYAGDYGLSLAWGFLVAGLYPVLQPLQALVVASILGLQLMKKWVSAAWPSALALCFFLILNMHFWNYFWLTPAIWLIGGALVDAQNRQCYDDRLTVRG